MKQNGTIFLVEDNPRDEKLTRMALEESSVGNQIVVARDGEEALDYLFARRAFSNRDVKEMPTIVLLDLQLPKIDGLEVLRQIRINPQTKLLPVVILTSSDEEKDRLEGYKLGVNSYVCKPVDFEQFSHAIVQLGLYWTVVNKPPPTKK
jgi:two-component system, response regulator